MLAKIERTIGLTVFSQSHGSRVDKLGGNAAVASLTASLVACRRQIVRARKRELQELEVEIS